MTNEPTKPPVLCNVFLEDKINVCGKPATELIGVGGTEPPCFLPVCEEHDLRLADGVSFLIREMDGERIFAITFDLKKKDEETIMNEPLQSPSLEAEKPSA